MKTHEEPTLSNKVKIDADGDQFNDWSLLRVIGNQLHVGRTARLIRHNGTCPARFELRCKPSDGTIIAQCLLCGQKIFNQPILPTDVFREGFNPNLIRVVDPIMQQRFKTERSKMARKR